TQPIRFAADVTGASVGIADYRVAQAVLGLRDLAGGVEILLGGPGGAGAIRLGGRVLLVGEIDIMAGDVAAGVGHILDAAIGPVGCRPRVGQGVGDAADA